MTKKTTTTTITTSTTTPSALETLCAGGLAGLIAEVTMHPFDTISHRAKVHPNASYGSFAGAFSLILKQEGMRGYFAGIRATLAQSPPSTAVYFYTYESAKAFGLKLTNGANPDAVYFCAGAASELFASLVFVPLEVVKSRMQLGENPNRATGGVVSSTRNFKTVREALFEIYKERGIEGLTAGWKSGFVQDIAFSATQFLVYENLKLWRLQSRRKEKEVYYKKTSLETRNTITSNTNSSTVIPMLLNDSIVVLPYYDTLLCGCISGGIAAALTNPLDVLTSRLMVQDGSTGYGGNNMLTMLRVILKKEGPTALWRGTLPRVAQTAPLSAISFAVYEAMKSYLSTSGLFRMSDENPFGR
jgi:hypothetical protein